MEILKEYREDYADLLQQQQTIEIEMEYTKENILLYFLLVEINKYQKCDDNANLSEVLEWRYPMKFEVGDIFEDTTKWSGPHKFNYGDIIRDRKNNEMCIVVHEAKFFITLWRFQEERDIKFRKRKKTAKDIEIVTRMQYE